MSIATGEGHLIETILIAAVQQTTPDTATWSWNHSLIMNLCGVLGLIIARFAIQNKGKGPALPLLQPMLGPNFGLPELVAGISIGHVLGIGIILGLANTGAL
jgi:photosystem I subunit 10